VFVSAFVSPVPPHLHWNCRLSCIASVHKANCAKWSKSQPPYRATLAVGHAWRRRQPEGCINVYCSWRWYCVGLASTKSLYGDIARCFIVALVFRWFVGLWAYGGVMIGPCRLPTARRDRSIEWTDSEVNYTDAMGEERFPAMAGRCRKFD
jgi:hypothetical protein